VECGEVFVSTEEEEEEEEENLLELGFLFAEHFGSAQQCEDRASSSSSPSICLRIIPLLFQLPPSLSQCFSCFLAFCIANVALL